jgi:hypothetical protein
MDPVFFGLAWLSIAVLAIFFIVRRWRNPVNMMRIGIALIIFSFLAGLIFLMTAIIL